MPSASVQCFVGIASTVRWFALSVSMRGDRAPAVDSETDRVATVRRACFARHPVDFGAPKKSFPRLPRHPRCRAGGKKNDASPVRKFLGFFHRDRLPASPVAAGRPEQPPPMENMRNVAMPPLSPLRSLAKSCFSIGLGGILPD